jgi:hypothetical protein
MLFALVTLIVFLMFVSSIWDFAIDDVLKKNNVNPRVEIVLLIEYEFVSLGIQSYI